MRESEESQENYKGVDGRQDDLRRRHRTVMRGNCQEHGDVNRHFTDTGKGVWPFASNGERRILPIWSPGPPILVARGVHRAGPMARAKREKMRKGEHSVNRPPSKPFRCEVVSETVTIALRRRTSLEGNNQLFVRCSELDCQYIDANEPPCPVTLDLFADEVRERQRRREESH